jgi:hypothetical protein
MIALQSGVYIDPAYIFVIGFMIGLLFLFFKIITKAIKYLFSFTLLYGLAIGSSLWVFFDLVLSGTPPREAVMGSGLLSFGLVIPTHALDTLVPTPLGAIAVFLLIVWWMALVTTLFQKEHVPLLGGLINIFGHRYRPVAALMWGTGFWMAFGLGLPNFRALLTAYLGIEVDILLFAFIFIIGAGVIGLIEAYLRTNIFTMFKEYINLGDVFKGVKKAVK